MTNTKTIEALGTDATVVINDATITNTGGTVEASGAGANVDLDNSTIVGRHLGDRRHRCNDRDGRGHRQ